MKISKITSLKLLLILFAGFSLSMQLSVNREYQIKAVFLFNFTQFIEWPASTFPEGEIPLVIGVLGKNPFGNYLTETVSKEKVNNHPLVIQYYSSAEEVKACQILFINLSGSDKVEQALADLKGKNILTVSDAPDFLNQGGMIRFFTKDNKIQFQINHEAAKAANLVVSSKLLRLAEIFTPKK